MESGMLWGGAFLRCLLCVCVLIFWYIYIYNYIYKYLISSKLFLFNICTREPGWKDCQSVNLMFSLFIEKYDKPMFKKKKHIYFLEFLNHLVIIKHISLPKHVFLEINANECCYLKGRIVLLIELGASHKQTELQYVQYHVAYCSNCTSKVKS